MISIQEIELFWKNQSKEDVKTADDLFKLGRYAPALFFCHLALEKFLKSIVVRKIKNHAPLDHNLVRLSELAGLKISEIDMHLLSDISAFNIKGRYDDYRSEFYKKANKSYTEKYLSETKRIILWLKKQ